MRFLAVQHERELQQSKRSSTNESREEDIISALTAPHHYPEGKLQQKPIGCRALAEMAGVGNGTASEFFKRHFKGNFRGHANYRHVCKDASQLEKKLKALNKEYCPELTFGGTPPVNAIPTTKISY